MTEPFRCTRGARSLLAAILILGVSAIGMSSALAQVYRCESAGGVPVYQGTANGKDCQPIDLAPLTTIPAPDGPVRAKAAPAGARTTTGATAGTAAASARKFPAVTPASQRVRDDDRRQILEEELRKEAERLDGLRSQRAQLAAAPSAAALAGSTGEKTPDDTPATTEAGRLERDIERSQGNLDALRRELDAIGPARRESGQ